VAFLLAGEITASVLTDPWRHAQSAISLLSFAPRAISDNKTNVIAVECDLSGRVRTRCNGGEDVLPNSALGYRVAFLSSHQHPEPTGTRRATPPLIFNVSSRDIP
jgi:hypothetical protein